MNCTLAAEVLPWYLNGTLDPDETARLEAHLESCARCRQEHREVAFAAAAFASHPPAEDLVDFAFHRLAMSPRRGVVERHLKSCAECAEEVRLVEASRDSLAELEATGADEPPRTSSQVVPIVRELRPRGATSAAFWRNAALAASIAAIVGSGLWLWNVSPGPTQVAQGQGSENGEDARASFGPSLPKLSAGDTATRGAALVSIQPGTLTQNTGADGASLVEIPIGAQELRITLRLPELEESAGLELQVLNAGNRVMWRGGVLTSAGDGLYSSTLPLEFMTFGVGSLRVRQRIGDRSDILTTLPIELIRR